MAKIVTKKEFVTKNVKQGTNANISNVMLLTVVTPSLFLAYSAYKKAENLSALTMCGRFQVEPSPKLDALIDSIGVKGEIRYAHDIAPGAPISIIHGRQINTATWWLLLDPETLKPNYKYASFNSCSDKLNSPRSIAYKPFRESRCIIPATAFVEGVGDTKTYHKIQLLDRALAFGGLFKSFLNTETGEAVFSASIITLPPLRSGKTSMLRVFH